MNLILLYPADQVGERFLLRDHRHRHLRSVLKAEPGQHLRVGLLDGPLGDAEVLACDPTSTELAVTFSAPPPLPQSDLILAMPRPKSLKKILPEVAALGVGRLTLIRSWRVEKAFLGSPILRPDEYEPLLDEGLMQAGATQRPQVAFEPRFRPFVEERLPAQLAGRTGLVAHPYAATRLADLSLAADTPVTLAIGPEGGFLPVEIQSLEAAGMRPVSLGPRILRVETAVVAVLAQLDLLRQRARPRT